jgi:cyanophycin synthetase
MTEARISVEIVTSDDDGTASHELWFESSRPLPVSTTSVALALSTLCGRAYGQVRFDFPVADEVLGGILEVTGARLSTGGQERWVDVPRRGHLLCFSGGFDSLAARSLMPDETALVSIDFGGRFARERKFFSNFDTLRVSTNLVETPFRKNSWSFMGIAAILAGDYYRARYLTFGSILEAGPENMRPAPAAAKNATFPIFREAGYSSAPYVQGLTEIGTLKVILGSVPEIIGESLLSLASPGDEKLYRKRILARLAADACGVSVELPEITPPPRPHFAFGENFLVDFLCIYAINRLDAEQARLLVRDIPDEVIEVAGGMRLDFYERANTVLYEGFPAELRSRLYSRLAEYGIGWYTEDDWREYGVVRNLLSKYHPAVG